MHNYAGYDLKDIFHHTNFNKPDLGTKWV